MTAELTLGCDVGSLLTKLVLVRSDGDLVGSSIQRTTGTVAAELPAAMDALLERHGARPGDLYASASTGSGAELAPRVDFEEDTTAAVVAAARRLLPQVDLVLDAGGQSITAVAVDDGGRVRDLVRNDKCASGTGRFLELMSEALGTRVTELDALARAAGRPAPISTQCGVFVESEVITHLNAGRTTGEVAAGLCEAAASIVASQLRRFRAARRFTLAGGLGRIDAVAGSLARRVEARFSPLPIDPLLAAAYGAGLLAFEDDEELEGVGAAGGVGSAGAPGGRAADARPGPGRDHGAV